MTGVIDVFNAGGTKTDSFDGNFTINDGLAIGRNPYPDADLDGLLDSWETIGLDADGDGTIDVDLPSFGRRPTAQGPVPRARRRGRRGSDPRPTSTP